LDEFDVGISVDCVSFEPMDFDEGTFYISLGRTGPTVIKFGGALQKKYSRYAREDI